MIVRVEWLLEDDAGVVHEVVVRGFVAGGRVSSFRCIDAAGRVVTMNDGDRARAEEDLIEAAHAAWPKQCGCGARHYAGEWTLLPFVGFQELGDDERLELRNCACGSTLSVDIEPKGIPWTLAQDLATIARLDAERARGVLDPYAWPPRRGVTDFVLLEDLAESKRLDAIAEELDAQRTGKAA